MTAIDGVAGEPFTAFAARWRSTLVAPVLTAILLDLRERAQIDVRRFNLAHHLLTRWHQAWCPSCRGEPLGDVSQPRERRHPSSCHTVNP